MRGDKDMKKCVFRLYKYLAVSCGLLTLAAAPAGAVTITPNETLNVSNGNTAANNPLGDFGFTFYFQAKDNNGNLVGDVYRFLGSIGAGSTLDLGGLDGQGRISTATLNLLNITGNVEIYPGAAQTNTHGQVVGTMSINSYILSSNGLDYSAASDTAALNHLAGGSLVVNATGTVDANHDGIGDNVSFSAAAALMSVPGSLYGNALSGLGDNFYLIAGGDNSAVSSLQNIIVSWFAGDAQMFTCSCTTYHFWGDTRGALSSNAVPEPATLLLLTPAAVLARRKRKQAA
jgi:hypothetical protein